MMGTQSAHSSTAKMISRILGACLCLCLLAAVFDCAASAAGTQGRKVPPKAKPTEVVLLPGSVILSGPRADQQFLVQGRYPGGHEADLTKEAAYTSSDPRIATIDSKGRVSPVGDGEATISAQAGGCQASAKVTVRDMRKPFVPSFTNHVLPVMTKAGCNSGACHGAAAGKNGFKLTLRGYDPELDYMVLTRQALGRRVNKLEPARSLMLLKPTLTLAHGGGKRFEVGSREYEILSSWIAAGTPPLSDLDARIRDLEVFPNHDNLAPGAEQQI